jgi:hypothetical protein
MGSEVREMCVDLDRVSGTGNTRTACPQDSAQDIQTSSGPGSAPTFPKEKRVIGEYSISDSPLEEKLAD